MRKFEVLEWFKQGGFLKLPVCYMSVALVIGIFLSINFSISLICLQKSFPQASSSCDGSVRVWKIADQVKGLSQEIWDFTDSEKSWTK